MIGREYGNGTMNDIARLITRDIPIHINCCERKSLLLLNWNVCNVMFIKCYFFKIYLTGALNMILVQRVPSFQVVL